MKSLFSLFLTFAACLLAFAECGTLVASEPFDHPFAGSGLIDLSASFQPDSVRPGEKTRLTIKAVLEPDWYIYSIVPSKDEDAPPPTTIEIASDFFSEEGELHESRPLRKFMPEIGFSISYHLESAFFYKDLRLKSEKHPKECRTVVKVRYQLCSSRVCMPEEEKKLEAVCSIVPPDSSERRSASKNAIVPPGGGSESSLTSLLFSPKGWAFMALAALMGFFSLLTPCVLPMIPITVSWFSKQGRSRGKTVRLAIIFAMGIVFTYTGAGVFLSAFFGADTALRLASNPWLNLAIAVVFIFFALSLMGLFEFSLPPYWTNYFDRKSRYLGEVPGLLLMGFTFTLTAFTCTVQFVGTMLIAAAHGDRLWPLTGMLIFSTVFALPFFLLALIPGLIKKVQGKSGVWLIKSKTVLGILELMIVVKFLSNADLIWKTELLSRNVAILIWMLLLLAIVIYLLRGLFRPRLSKSFFQWGITAVFIAAIILLSRGWNDKPLGGVIDSILPPPNQFAFGDEKVQWLESLEEGQKLAVAQNKPLFVEFTGYTCMNCRWMEQNVLSRKDVVDLLKNNFVAVRLFTDGGEHSRRNLDLQINRFKTVALPFYVIIVPASGSERTFSGVSLKAENFIDFLNVPNNETE